MRNRYRLASGLILLGFAITVVQIIAPVQVADWAGLSYWSAVLLLWPKLAARSRFQCLILLGLSALCLLWGQFHGMTFNPERLVTGNGLLISMLVAVSFLGLISRPDELDQTPLPRGRRAAGSTLVSTHVFGAVINMSAIFIIGDRISRRTPLSATQALVLVRGFSTAALWSPLFAATAVALNYAPNAHLPTLWLTGLLLAGMALGLTFYQLYHSPAPDIHDFQGYPMRLDGLYLPVALGCAILLALRYAPSLSVLEIITLLGPALSFVLLPIFVHKPRLVLSEHLSSRLPQMANEIALFQAAGALGYGVDQVIRNLDGWQPIQTFGAFQACVCYCAIVVLSLLGIHPIVSVAFFGSLLTPMTPDPTLLAMVFLTAWSFGTLTGPLSGLNLAIQGRYGIDSFRMMRLNLRFMLCMSGLAMAAFYLLRSLD